MNYIEREVERLRPDVAVIRATPERQEVYLYTERFEPSVIPALPTHWDRFNVGRDVTQQADILEPLRSSPRDNWKISISSGRMRQGLVFNSAWRVAGAKRDSRDGDFAACERGGPACRSRA